jgi:DNA-binding PadR family transcriptional regulator
LIALIEEKPRHGYELIKELELKFGGGYAPSPGSVYPTLMLLEELEYIRGASTNTGSRRRVTGSVAQSERTIRSKIRNDLTTGEHK